MSGPGTDSVTTVVSFGKKVSDILSSTMYRLIIGPFVSEKGFVGEPGACYDESSNNLNFRSIASRPTGDSYMHVRGR